MEGIARATGGARSKCSTCTMKHQCSCVHSHGINSSGRICTPSDVSTAFRSARPDFKLHLAGATLAAAPPAIPAHSSCLLYVGGRTPVQPRNAQWAWTFAICLSLHVAEKESNVENGMFFNHAGIVLDNKRRGSFCTPLFDHSAVANTHLQTTTHHGTLCRIDGQRL